MAEKFVITVDVKRIEMTKPDVCTYRHQHNTSCVTSSATHERTKDTVVSLTVTGVSLNDAITKATKHLEAEYEPVSKPDIVAMSEIPAGTDRRFA